MRKLLALLLVAACGEVKAKPPGTFSIALDTESAFVRENGTLEIAITVTREELAEPIAITANGLPDGISAEPLEIAGDSTVGTLVIDAAAVATHGRATLQITGTAEVGGGVEPVTAAAPLALLVGGAPGTLDRSFAADGTFTPTLGGLAMACRDLVITEQGIVVTGFVVSNPVQAITARVLEDGTLDPAFGSGGFVSTGVGSIAEGIAIDALPDGSVLVAGIAGGTGAECEFGVFKYTASGALDGGFGQSGVVPFDPGVGCAEWHTMLLAPDGGVIVGGTVFDGGNITLRAAKYATTNGDQDMTFGAAFGGVNVQGSALQPDGKYFMVGQEAGNFWVQRFFADSVEDASFAATPDFGGTDAAHGVVVLPDGKVFVIGTTTNGGSQIAMARFNTNGSLDVTFGGGQKMVGAGFESRSPTAIAATDTHVYFVGRLAADDRPAVARIALADGSLDTTFGEEGVAAVDFGIVGTTAATGGFGVAVDPEGRVVISGDVGAAGGQSMAIARLWF